MWCICINSCELNCTSNSMLVYKYGAYTAHTCTASARSIDFRGNFWHTSPVGVCGVRNPFQALCSRHRQHEFVFENIIMYVEQSSQRRFLMFVFLGYLLYMRNAHLANLIMLRWLGTVVIHLIFRRLRILCVLNFNSVSCAILCKSRANVIF